MKDGRNREASVFMHHKDGHRVPISSSTARALRPDDGAVFGSVAYSVHRCATRSSTCCPPTPDDAVDPITGTAHAPVR